MPKNEPRVLCETPTPGKKGVRIPQWKYDAVRAAIRKIVPRSKEGIEFMTMFPQVGKAMSAEDRKNLGALMWHVTVVKLDLECRGEIERVPDSKPQRIRRVK